MGFSSDMRIAVEQRAPVYLAGLFAMAIGASACGGSTPTAPKPQPIPEKPNAPPVITSLSVANPRVDADGEVTVTAVVEDAETAVDQLSYQWSALPVNGDFTGQGREVRWRAPKAQKTPDSYTLSLAVTEKYTALGQPAENKVTKTVDIHYNDSQSEVLRIGMRFLTELFPTYAVSPQDAVQDFADSCPGKGFELSDVTNNRKNFHILSGSYTNVSVTLNGAKTTADVSGLCTFVDIPQQPSDPNFGRREAVSGICALTAVYENWRWYLCDSGFRGLGTTPLEQLRYRVPGRILQ
jgi:hypothetical protein